MRKYIIFVLLVVAVPVLAQYHGHDDVVNNIYSKRNPIDSYVYLEKQADSIAYVYMKENTNNRWWLMDIRRHRQPANRWDTWHINLLYYTDDKFHPLDSDSPSWTVATLSGAWENAIAIKDVDWLGSYGHYNQEQDTSSWYADGKRLTWWTASDDTVWCAESIQLTQTVAGLRPDTKAEICEIGQEYLFEKNNLFLTQRVLWESSDSLSTAYFAMCPVKRNVGISYFAKFVSDADIYDVSNSGHSFPNEKRTGLVTWNQNNDLSIRMELVGEPLNQLDSWNNCGSSFSFVSNSADPAYNKFYIAWVSATTYVASGDVWWSKVKYSFY